MIGLKTICVFAGSGTGNNGAFRASALSLANALADRNLNIVFGGGKTGLMGVLADQALSRGCQVVGVIPGALVQREMAHTGLTEQIVVDSMHARKATMAARSDAFIALPGGMGTLEELFEILTWMQLGLHTKPCGILNVDGYYDSLLAFLDHATQSEFIRPGYRSMVEVDSDPALLLECMEQVRLPARRQWISETET